MRFARFPAWLAPSLLLLLVLPAAGTGCGGDDPRLPTNVVLISLDTLRADHLGVYGYERDTSPAIDALAAESLVFERAYSHSPKTAPSHMTILTGLLPPSHGVNNLDPESDNRALGPAIPTLASLLSDAGYRGFAFTGGGHVISKLGFDRGFERFQTGGGARGVFERGLQVLREHPEDPLFLFLHTYHIHDPYTPRSRYRSLWADAAYAGGIIGDRAALMEASDDTWSEQHRVFWERVDRESDADRRHLVDLYDAGIREADAYLDGFLEGVRELGMAERTVVILLSDHGEEFFDHGGVLHESVYEEVLRVPLIVHVPRPVRGQRLAPRRIDAMVGLVDVLPTVLDLLDLPRLEHAEGRSLLEHLDGDAPPRPVLSHWPSADHWALLDRETKVIRVGSERVELFDLASDPREMRNLAEIEVARRDASLGRLDEMIESSRTLKSRFESGATAELSGEEADHLRALGYLQAKGEGGD